VFVNKLLILISFLSVFLFGSEARSQCYYNCYYGGGYAGASLSYPFYGAGLGWNATTGVWAVNQAINVIQDTWTMIERDRAIEAELQARRNNLENYKSVQRYYTEGIPAFAPVAPNGKPRSPKITWQDVESIR